jgi:hypothetical protein
MTEDYKKNILNYITNMVNKTTPTTDEIFVNETRINRNKWLGFFPRSWTDFRYEGMVAPDETTTGLGVLYGGYLDTDNNVRGIITLFNNDFEPIKTIYEYSSGTPLRYIQCMKQAEDGTFYFIDDRAFSYTQREQVLTSQKRFVMVNNFTILNSLTNDYEVNFRASYLFRGNYTNFYCKNMFKNPNSSNYIFFGDGVDSTTSSYEYRYLKIIGLKVNVGEENIWTLYTNSQNSFFGGAFALFDDDNNVMFRCLNTNISFFPSTTIECVSKTYTGSVQKNTIVNFSSSLYIDEINYKKQCVFLSMDEVYFVLNNQHWGTTGTLEDKEIGLYKYNFNTENLTIIAVSYLGEYDFCNLEAIYIDKCGADIYVQYNINIDGSSSDYYFQRLVNDTWNPILIAEDAYFVFNQRTMFIKSNFNLTQAYLYATNPRGQTWFQYLIKEDYNALNYNGEPYIDYNSTIPYKAEIYSNNSLVFARNLYNLTTNANQSNATVVVPNSYLNGINLTRKNLLSETNSEIVVDTNTITKNIYETLYLNFINTTNVINEGTNTNYPLAATYVTENINTGTQQNCETTSVGKIRLNKDGSSEIRNIYWKTIDDTHKQTTIGITMTESVLSIDFISNDETTIYSTIDTSNLEVGNTYNITQSLRIE